MLDIAYCSNTKVHFVEGIIRAVVSIWFLLTSDSSDLCLLGMDAY